MKVDSKLPASEKAFRRKFPTPDIDIMLAEIE